MLTEEICQRNSNHRLTRLLVFQSSFMVFKVVSWSFKVVSWLFMVFGFHGCFIVFHNNFMVFRSFWLVFMVFQWGLVRLALKPKIQNWDFNTWILMEICILNLICTLSAFQMQFYRLHFLQGKNDRNRPKNQQNWNLAKIGPKNEKSWNKTGESSKVETNWKLWKALRNNYSLPRIY